MDASMVNTIYQRISELNTDFKRIAWRFSAPCVPADDIYQSIIERVIVTCKPADARSYICQCATWHAKNMIASEIIYEKHVGLFAEKFVSEESCEDDVLDLSIDPNPTPEEYVLKKYQAEDILNIIGGLDKTNQEIADSLILGETHQEIADRLHLSRQAVTNRVASMRGAFRLAGIIPV